MFRTIETSIWDDPKVINLPPLGKLLFAYLITNRHSHLSGIYYLPDSLISTETGIQHKNLDTLWDTLSDSGLSWNDKKTHVVFVKNMFRYQGRGDKNLRAAANNIKTLHNSILINRFLESYPEIKRYGIDRVSDTPSEFGVKNQEQEQKKNKETTLASSDKSLSAGCACFTELPCTGKQKTFLVMTEYVLEMKTLYPGIDIEKETLRAKGWLVNNPAKRKTYQGMTHFLANWYSRAQNNGGNGNGRKPEPESIFDQMRREADEEERNAKQAGD